MENKPLNDSMPSLIDVDIDVESVCELPKTIVSDDNRFTGKVIVITGAAGDFGRAGCLYFARRGARIAALDRSKEGLKDAFNEMVEELGSNSFDFKPYVCDVTHVGQITQVIESIVFRFKSIDYLWNNAGYQGKIKRMLDYDPEDFKLVMEINVTGMFLVMQQVAKQMSRQHGAGVIVNTASVAGLRGTPGMIAYSSSKAAVIALTIAAAKDLADFGIRVNCVSPALIGPGFLWDRQNKLHAKMGPPFYPKDPSEVAKSKIKQVPLKRLGTVDEVIKSVCFLMSDESSYTTGVNLEVDGGMSAGLKG